MAHQLLAAPRVETAGVCFHAQQAAEKSLKAILVLRQVEFEWSHEIEYLLELCVRQDGAFDVFRQSAPSLTKYAVRFRYPTHAPDPSVRDARAAVALAEQINEVVLDRVPVQARPVD